MNYKTFLFLTLSIPAFVALPVFGQGQPPGMVPTRRPTAQPVAAQPQNIAPPSGIMVAPAQKGQLQSFAFESAPLEVVMEEYGRWTDKMYLKPDTVKANITLKADKLTTEESIKVVEAILAMNNIALVPMGERYVKVVQATAADIIGQGVRFDKNPNSVLGDGDGFVAKIVQLKNVEIPEVQAAVQHVLHAYGKILGLPRSNSLMITDTEVNIKRALEVIEFIDQATAGIDSRIYQIEHAEAQDIASKLKEIVEAAKGEDPAPTGNPYARTVPGVIRPGARPTAPAAPTQASIGQTESGATTIIHGEVKIIADERTNLIMIFSQEENFDFFDKIIKVLDIEVEPATTFEVIGLEYADAVELSGTLNELIGGASGARSSSSTSSTSRNSAASRNSTASRTTGTSRTASGSRMTPNQAPGTAGATIDNLNKLSEDTKILADERSNSIILMGSKGDIIVMKQVIKSLDIMLEQVIIEAAIFEIGLTDTLRHGLDWLYRASGDQKVGAWDGQNLIGSTNGLGTVAAGALTYYQNLTGINTEIAINLAATDTDARLLATPVIMTTDNTEASLSIGEQRPVVTSTDSYVTGSGSSRSNYEYKDIGIQLTVTPRINPQRFVVMELVQKADQIGEIVEIDGNQVPTINNREFSASIAVPDGGTVALGGMIQSEISDTVTKIPILGDIPLIGRYLFSSVNKEERQRELVVLMTPYVMTDMDEMRSETSRLYQGTTLRQKDWKGSWSESPLRNLPDPVETDAEDRPSRTQQRTAPRVEPAQPAPTVQPKRSSTEPSTLEMEDMMRMLEEMNYQPAG